MSQPRVNFQSFSRITYWFLGVLAVVIQFLVQLSLGTMIDDVSISFQLNASQSGLLAGAYYPVYCLMQAPSGLLVSHFGARRVLCFGLALAGMTKLVFALAPWFWLVLICRLFLGLGLSCCFVSMSAITYQWFDAKHYGMLLGIAETLILIAIMSMAMWIPKLVIVYGWHTICLLLALLILLASTVCYLVLPVEPKVQSRSMPFKKIFQTFLNTVADYLTQPVFLSYTVFGGALFAILTVFEGLWSQPFFCHAWSYPIIESSAANVWLLLGVMCGAPVLGWVAQKTWRHYVMTIIAILQLGLFYVVITFGHQFSYATIHVLMWILGLMASGYIMGYVILAALVKVEHRNIVVGLHNMLVVMPALFIQPLVGWWIDHSLQSNIRLKYVSALNRFDGLLLGMLLSSVCLMIYYCSKKRWPIKNLEPL